MPIVYGDDATAVKCASNGPDGGAAFGGGPPKLIYLDIWNFHVSRYCDCKLVNLYGSKRFVSYSQHKRVPRWQSLHQRAGTILHLAKL